MQTDKKLISVLVTSYKNNNYLFECLASIVNQTYEKIEIVITDDGSNDFIIESLEAWFNLYSKENIVDVKINQNERNLGTVKNVNVGLKLCSGDYITMIAADDKYYCDTVFSQAIRVFERQLPPEALVLITQIGMCDQWMNFQYNFMNERVIETLMYKDVNDLLKLELIGSVLPACGTFYKREVFERFGLCDERYDLIEDYVLHLKLLKNGIRFYYVGVVSVLHRAGGVSHGKEGPSKQARFWKDCMLVYDNEVIPLLDEYLNEEEKEEVLDAYKRTELRHKIATGEIVTAFQVVDAKKSVFFGALISTVAFAIPRARTISKYIFIFSLFLCFSPNVFDFSEISFIGNWFVAAKNSTVGAILLLLSITINILIYIAEFVISYMETKRHFTSYPIASYLQSIGIE